MSAEQKEPVAGSPIEVSRAYDTHARHVPALDVPSSLDDVLHLSRYTWCSDQFGGGGVRAVDLGCGEGYGSRILARSCASVIGVDLMKEQADDGDGPLRFLEWDVTSSTLRESRTASSSAPCTSARWHTA